MDDGEYEVIPDRARILGSHLVDLFHKLGLREDITADDVNEVVWTFIERVVFLWKKNFPNEYYDWISGLEDELKYERPVKKAVEGGGFTPISYPMRFWNLMRTFFPKLKLTDKKFIKEFIRRIPEFKNTNYKL